MNLHTMVRGKPCKDDDAGEVRSKVKEKDDEEIDVQKLNQNLPIVPHFGGVCKDDWTLKI